MRDGQIENIALVANVVTKVKSALEKRNKLKLTKVCIAAAGRALITKKSNLYTRIKSYRRNY